MGFRSGHERHWICTSAEILGIHKQNTEHRTIPGPELTTLSSSFFLVPLRQRLLFHPGQQGLTLSSGLLDLLLVMFAMPHESRSPLRRLPQAGATRNLLLGKDFACTAWLPVAVQEPALWLRISCCGSALAERYVFSFSCPEYH